MLYVPWLRVTRHFNKPEKLVYVSVWFCRGSVLLLYYLAFLACERGGIGRRTRFRFWRREV